MNDFAKLKSHTEERQNVETCNVNHKYNYLLVFFLENPKISKNMFENQKYLLQSIRDH